MMVRRALSLAVAALCGLAGWWSIRLARADWLARGNSLVALAAAARWDPGNGQHLAWLAELEEQAGQDPTPTLRRAAALDPRNSWLWIRLGLRAEADGDFARAEQSLLEAARVDKQFDPRSTLAQYYFRRGNAEQAWRWMRAALDISYGDLAPLFRICWQLSQDAEEIRRRAIPERPEVMAKYLRFLLDQGRLDALAPVAAHVRDVDVLLAACDRLLEARRVGDARAVWNALPGARLEDGLTNGDFRAAPLGHGFDWRIASVPEVLVTRLGTPPGLRFTFNGRQPERCTLLEQYMPLRARTRYRLQFQYRTSVGDSGLRWRILDSVTPPLASEEWSEGELIFSSGDTDLARLALDSERASGTPRFEGWLMLRAVQLSKLP